MRPSSQALKLAPYEVSNVTLLKSSAIRSALPSPPKAVLGTIITVAVWSREPNILSDDDVFQKGERQKPIKKAMLEEWSNIDNIPLGSETKKNYNRNKKLIDLSQIPKTIETNIINTYNNYKVKDRSLLLPYFIGKKLKTLIDKINDF